MRELTLCFTSPLRWHRPKAAREPVAGCFDRRYFEAPVFAQRTIDRLAELGLWSEDMEVARRDARLVDNQLVWLDISYGMRASRKALGGAVGCVRLRLHRPELVRALVLGQYARVGEATRFGFGAYRIQELGPPPFACRRAARLIDLALESTALDQAAQDYGVGSGRIRRLARDVAAGRYRPEPVIRFVLPGSGSRQRLCAMPRAPDRALQRAVLAQISPALDVFFEDSSVAYRKGLGRQRAAEQIAAEGARLVRYSDDFLVLVRSEQEAQQRYQSAREAAEALHLRLNEDKSQQLDLHGPFEFLGFRFQRFERWEVDPGQPPRHVDQLGWCETRTDQRGGQRSVLLPGETSATPPAEQATVLVGPGLARLDVAQGELVASYHQGRPATRVPLDRVGDVLALGMPELRPAAVKTFTEGGRTLLVADHSGLVRGILGELPDPGNAELLVAQVAMQTDESRRLAIARQLVIAKLQNYAALAAAALPAAGDDGVATGLRALAASAPTCKTVEELLGMEGAGAARWYQHFGARLGGKFTFKRRVAPHADDPVNALLNFGQTILYRLCASLLWQEGFAPSLGVLHRPRPGHAALASDLQEPFRHLMDRAVIEATAWLKPGDFKEDRQGPYPLRLRPDAARRFAASVLMILTTGCCGRGEEHPRSYRQHIAAAARSLHRHLLDHHTAFHVFEHP